MSHFSLYVLMPKDTDDIDGKLTSMLEPYNENTSVDSYEEPCWCISTTARRFALDTANAVKSIDQYRTEYHALKLAERPDWESFIAPYREIESKAFESHPNKGCPIPNCEDCDGTGTQTTNYNPQSKWDWWVIGGRWTGALSCGEYDPTKDPNNTETCNLCNGTGTRPGGLEEFGQRWFDSCKGCNGCLGTGTRTKWPTSWVSYPNDVRPVSDLLTGQTEWPPFTEDDLTSTDDDEKSTYERITNESGEEAARAWMLKTRTDERARQHPGLRVECPYAFMTPDGEWHARGDMGWFGMSSDEQPASEYAQSVYEAFSKNADCFCVVVDCHI